MEPFAVRLLISVLVIYFFDRVLEIIPINGRANQIVKYLVLLGAVIFALFGFVPLH